LNLPREFPQYHRPVILSPSRSCQSTSIAMKLLERLTRAKRFFVAVELVVRSVRQVEKPDFWRAGLQWGVSVRLNPHSEILKLLNAVILGFEECLTHSLPIGRS
jgi:hypothetical protein